ncbi:PAPA-1-like conserved region-domain-containing protein, partial [Fennellomyces sp. T-0311]
LTKRQRAKLEDNPTEEFLELPMESAKKKHLTAEEQTLKRSEVARRRKNQSIQRAEKDKEDTINRLLKKQASKSRKVIKDDAADEKESDSARRAALARDPNSLQYVSNAKGSFLSIPSSISIEQVFG